LAPLRHTDYSVKSFEIIFSVGNAGNFVHETTHGGQFETGGIAYDKDSGKSFGNDLYDEIAAYRAQFAFNHKSVSGLKSSSNPNSFETITVKWLNDLEGLYKSHPYSDTGSARVGRIPITINSTLDLLTDAYPWMVDTFKKYPGKYTASYTIKSDSYYIWRQQLFCF
jgi:hypothetical protein